MNFCSIIIPFQNSSLTIKKCLNSAINQTGIVDYDIILINDYSVDNSSEIIKKIIKKKTNCRMLYSTKRTVGPGHARNIGIKDSKSEYLFFLDSDDFLRTDALINIKKANKKKVDLICCNYNVLDKVGNLKKKSRFDLSLYLLRKKIIIKNFFSLSIIPQVISNLISRRLVSNNKIKFNNGYFEDIYFFFKVLFFSKKISILKKKIYIKNNRKNSIVNSLSINHINDSFNNYYKCYLFSKKNKKYMKKLNLEYLFMHAVVGQVAVLIKRINLLERKIKSKYLTFKNIIKNHYKFKTKKDVIAKKFLYS